MFVARKYLTQERNNTDARCVANSRWAETHPTESVRKKADPYSLQMTQSGPRTPGPLHSKRRRASHSKSPQTQELSPTSAPTPAKRARAAEVPRNPEKSCEAGKGPKQPSLSSDVGGVKTGGEHSARRCPATGKVTEAHTLALVQSCKSWAQGQAWLAGRKQCNGDDFHTGPPGAAVHNVGNGSCFIHTWYHGRGKLPLTNGVMSEAEVNQCRAKLVDAALQTVTGQSKLNMQAAPTTLLRVSRTMIQRAQALDLDWAGLPSDRQDLGALLGELRTFLNWKKHIPAPWWMLVAEMENITVCVWQPGAARDKRIPFMDADYALQPLVYCPEDPQQECLPRAMHVLFHAEGYPDAQLLQAPLDGSGVGLRPDHYAYINVPEQQRVQQQPQTAQEQTTRVQAAQQQQRAGAAQEDSQAEAPSAQEQAARAPATQVQQQAQAPQKPQQHQHQQQQAQHAAEQTQAAQAQQRPRSAQEDSQADARSAQGQQQQAQATQKQQQKHQQQQVQREAEQTRPAQQQTPAAELERAAQEQAAQETATQETVALENAAPTEAQELEVEQVMAQARTQHAAQTRPQDAGPASMTEQDACKVTCHLCSTNLQLAKQRPAATISAHVSKCKTMAQESRLEERRNMLRRYTNSISRQINLRGEHVPSSAALCAQHLKPCATETCMGVVATANGANKCIKCTGRRTSQNPYAKQTQPQPSATQRQQQAQQRQQEEGQRRTPPGQGDGQQQQTAQQQERRHDADAQTATMGLCPDAAPLWTQDTPCVANALDTVTTDALLSMRFPTSARGFRSALQRQRYSVIMSHAWGLFACTLDRKREAERAVAAGAGACANHTSTTSLLRCTKLLHLLSALLFGKQKQGDGVTASRRLDLVFRGDIADLVQRAVASAQQPVTSHTNAHCAAEPDADFSEADRRLHEGCARLADQRGGIAQAARRLEVREGSAPANEQQQAVFALKHPKAGSLTPDGSIHRATGDSVRTAAAQALGRWHARISTRRGNADDLQEQVDPDSHVLGTPLTVSAADVLHALGRTGAGKSAGLDGTRFEHILDALGAGANSAGSSGHHFSESNATPRFVDDLAKAFTILLNEPTLLPEECWRLMRAASITGIGVKNRPIACSSVWRRLMASIANRKVSGPLAEHLTTLCQFGVGVPAGVEHVAVETRLWHELFGVVLQLDCKNAFNSVCRLGIIRGLERWCPELLPHFASIYCGLDAPEMRAELRRADGADIDSDLPSPYTVRSEVGCQQGDPLGPLWFSVALTNALHPETGATTSNGDFSATNSPTHNASGPAATSTDSDMDTDSDTEDLANSSDPRHQLSAQRTRDVAYLDDTNALLGPVFDDAAEARVLRIQAAMASIGLEWHPGKSLAIAMRGRIFSPDERDRLRRLGVPFIDASTPDQLRGFVTVGAPTGSDAFVIAHLRRQLLENAPLWRLAWHLGGMGERHLQQAQRLLRGSLCKRFGYAARLVDPRLSAPWLGGYDAMCAWTLERMLQLRGAASACQLREHLERTCSQGDTKAASEEGPLVLKQLGPAELPALPLLVSRQQNGGLGLPDLSKTCFSSFVAQAQGTLAPRLQDLLDLCVPSGSTVPGLSLAPLVQSYRGALAHLLNSTALAEHLGPHPTCEWATRAAEPSVRMDSEDRGAYTAIMSAQLRVPRAVSDPPDLATAAPTNPLSAEESQTGPGYPDPEHNPSMDEVKHRNGKGLQKMLMKYQRQARREELHTALEAGGEAGLRCMAQLRSQAGRFSMAWLNPSHAPLTGPALATMLLISLFIDVWHISGDECPYGCRGARPSTVHAVGCHKQHIWGPNAVHTQQKRKMQQICRGNHVSRVENEDSSMFTVGSGLRELRGDTVVYPRGLLNCEKKELREKGFIIDQTVRTPTCPSYLVAAKCNASNTDGYATEAAEKEKDNHHRGRFCAQRWMFVPFVQESFGRLGRRAASFVEELASHSATCKGGDELQISRARGRILVAIRTELSTSLAKAVAERVLAYIRGANMKGRACASVSMLLK